MRPFISTILGISFLICTNLSSYSQTDSISIDTVSNYQGWGWDVLVIKNSYITLAVVPAIGGRILAYNLAVDTFMITNPAQYGKVYYTNTNNPYNGSWGYGGFKTWPAPQSVWNWPPPPTLAWGNYDYQLLKANNDSLTLLLKGSTETIGAPGLRFNRYITAYSNTTRVKITTVLINDSDHTQSWGIWDNTQCIVKHANDNDFSNFSIYFPLKSESDISIGSLGNVQDRSMVLPGIYKVQYTPKQGKIFANVSGGWSLFVDERDKQAYAKIFDLKPVGDYPTGEKPVEVYTDASVNYLEWEIIGPSATITSGDSSSFTENWFAAKTSGPVYNTVPAGIVKTKLAYNSNTGTITGEYGIFSNGKISWSFLDDNFSDLGSGGNINVTPLETAVLNQSVSLPAKTRYIKLTAYDVNDKEIGDLDTLDLDQPTSITASVARNFTVKINYPYEQGADINLIFTAAKQGYVSVALYSVSGELVKTPLNIWLEPGDNYRSISSQGLSTGIYLVKVIAQNSVQTFKVPVK